MTGQAQCLAVAGNYALVQLPQRRFPALAVQGDSMKCLQEAVEELRDAVSSKKYEDIEHPLREVFETVASFVASYEDMMAQKGLKLPYAANG